MKTVKQVCGLILGVLAVGVGGCSSPRVTTMAPSQSAAASGYGAEVGSMEAAPVVQIPAPGESLVPLVSLAFAHAADEGVRSEVLAAIAGREAEFLSDGLDRALRESRDVQPVFHDVTRAIGQRGDGAEAASVVREVAARSCCLRRSFGAACLDGLAVGLEEAGVGGWVDADISRRLGKLGRDRDEELAGAARRVAGWFKSGAPGSEP